MHENQATMKLNPARCNVKYAMLIERSALVRQNMNAQVAPKMLDWKVDSEFASILPALTTSTEKSAILPDACVLRSFHLIAALDVNLDTLHNRVGRLHEELIDLSYTILETRKQGPEINVQISVKHEQGLGLLID